MEAPLKSLSGAFVDESIPLYAEDGVTVVARIPCVSADGGCGLIYDEDGVTPIGSCWGANPSISWEPASQVWFTPPGVQWLDKPDRYLKQTKAKRSPSRPLRQETPFAVQVSMVSGKLLHMPNFQAMMLLEDLRAEIASDLDTRPALVALFDNTQRFTELQMKKTLHELGIRQGAQLSCLQKRCAEWKGRCYALTEGRAVLAQEARGIIQEEYKTSMVFDSRELSVEDTKDNEDLDEFLEQLGLDIGDSVIVVEGGSFNDASSAQSLSRNEQGAFALEDLGRWDMWALSTPMSIVVDLGRSRSSSTLMEQELLEAMKKGDDEAVQTVLEKMKK